MKIKYLIPFLLLVLTGCTSPNTIDKNMKMTDYDKFTKYNIENDDNGFNLTILYARYQFIPETYTHATDCKNQLISIASEFAGKENREIQPIDPYKIQVSIGRNIFSGTTSCGATTKVFWLNDNAE